MSTSIPQPMFEINLPEPERTKGEREYQAFLALLPQLLTTHRGKFVAVHEGQVVDSDADDITLIRRVHAKVGYVPVHVGLVDGNTSVVHVPHYREFRPGGESV